MVMPSQPAKRWTADEARRLNEANPKWWPRYEVIDGELLVSAAPRMVHQIAVQALISRLAPYTKSHRIGRTLASPADIELEPDSTVGPDVFVMPWENWRSRHWSEVEALVVAAEVLAPSTAKHDRVTKRRYFGRNNVPEYWIIDCDARVVERWHPGDERPEIISDTLVWMPADASEPFVLDLAEFFAEAFGEDVPL